MIFSAVNRVLSKAGGFGEVWRTGLVVVGVVAECDGSGVESECLEEVLVDAGFAEQPDIIPAAFAVCTIIAVYFSASADPRVPIIFLAKQVRMLASTDCSISV